MKVRRSKLGGAKLSRVNLSHRTEKPRYLYRSRFFFTENGALITENFVDAKEIQTCQ
jgi:hypothetical protein